MKIGLIDADGHNFPNLVLMKLSAWHKAQGDCVERWSGFEHYDVVYMSRVFTEDYSADADEPCNTDEIVKGGTGYADAERTFIIQYEQSIDGCQPGLCIGSPKDPKVWYQNTLRYEAEHIYPDYSMYPQLTNNTAYGFLTRGCPRGCEFCVVASKEGRKSCKASNLSEFWQGQKHIKLLDPNLLACPNHLELLKQLADSGAWVDFTQGLDIRLTTPKNIALLNRVKTKMLHFAWDNPQDNLDYFFKQFAELTTVKDDRKRCVYVLTNFGSTHEQDIFRVRRLQEIGYTPYIMIYNKPSAPQITLDLQRWCNNRIIFRASKGNFSAFQKRFTQELTGQLAL